MVMVDVRVIVVVVHVVVYFADGAAIAVHSIYYVRVLDAELGLRAVAAGDGRVGVAVADLRGVRDGPGLVRLLLFSGPARHVYWRPVGPAVVHLGTKLIYLMLSALVVVEVWQAHVLVVSQGLVVVDLIVATVDEALHAQLRALLTVPNLRLRLTVMHGPWSNRELVDGLA